MPEDVPVKRVPKRKSFDFVIEDDALTQNAVMTARGYERDPLTGSWIFVPSCG